MQEFVILKAFNVNAHLPNAPVIKEVLWQPPLYNWVKCNTDGSALGSPGLASCGGLFRDYTATFLGGFSINIGNSYALYAELLGVMNAIEIGHSKGWNNLWIESDSKLVNLAFNSSHIVPWKLRNRWFNCLELAKTMVFRVTHIYREGNCCADKMAALGINVDGFYWWENVLPSVQGDYISNLMDLLSFRFH
jgi:ribonuclease HI